MISEVKAQDVMDYILAAERSIWHQKRKILNQLESMGITSSIPPVEREIDPQAILCAIQSVATPFVRAAPIHVLVIISEFAATAIVTCQKCATEFAVEQGQHLTTYLRPCFRCSRCQFCYNCAAKVAFGDATNATQYFDCRTLGGGEGGTGACFTLYESNMCLIL